jgi:hypothetical protein
MPEEGEDDGTAMELKVISREAARHKKPGSSGGDRHRRIWFKRDVLLALPPSGWISSASSSSSVR